MAPRTGPTPKVGDTALEFSLAAIDGSMGRLSDQLKARGRARRGCLPGAGRRISGGILVADMYVQEVWRYPVKSMAGQPLENARVTPSGIDGDRLIQVHNARGRVVTARTHPRLLGLHATIDGEGRVLVDGRPWSDPIVRDVVGGIVGPGAQLVYNDGLDRFDILPLLVATDGAIAAFGHDRRRLRPNIVIGGVDGLEERTWEGSELRIGEAVVRIADLRARCVMTTFDPDTLVQDHSVLRDIGKRFGGKLALNCEVVRGGDIRVNQVVEVTAPAR
ncbi:MAG: MOSC N-terminal beta barrel domain-containing protein [Vicinamibacterales bacterium]